MTSPREPDEPDPLAAYAAGDPDAVRAAAPREPTEAEWADARERIHNRLAHPQSPLPRSWRVTGWLVGIAAISATAAAVAWAAFHLAAPPTPQTPEVAQRTPVVPAPPESPPDPLAEFAVLPMASSDDVVLHRVPGDGWVPVGTHPLPGVLSLASATEVELDDPDSAWPDVSPAPGFAPMIFAAKPR